MCFAKQDHETLVLFNTTKQCTPVVHVYTQDMAMAYFFLKMFFARSRSVPHTVSVFWPVSPTVYMKRMYYTYSALYIIQHIIQYNQGTILLYIWRFTLSQKKKIDQIPASQYLYGTLVVLVRYNQSQKCLQYDLKWLLQKNFFFN